MVPIQRVRDENAIRAKYRGNGKLRMESLLLTARRDSLRDPSLGFVFNEAYWKAAKSQLKKESFEKCAYCECMTSVVAHGDVEHFRPKGVYWWLAYTYDNYLYACQICNQTYKNDHFDFGGLPLEGPILDGNTTDQEIALLVGNISPDPLDINGGYSFQRYLQLHRAEDSYLINPYLDDPAVYFAYEADDTNEEVKLVARTPAFERYAKAAEDYFGINRIELRNFRYQQFKSFRRFKLALQRIDDPGIKTEIEAQLAEMMDVSYPFAGMHRYFNTVLP